MKNIVLDTNIILEIIRGRNQELVKNINTYIESFNDPRLCVSVVTFAEMHALATQFGWQQNKKIKLQDIFSKFIIIDASANIPSLIDAYSNIDAYSHGKIPSPKTQQKLTSHKNMSKNDLWIAATAYILSADLITTDKDFDHLHAHFFSVFKP